MDSAIRQWDLERERWRGTVTLGQRKSKSFSSSMYGKRKKNCWKKFSIFRILSVQRSYISTLPRLPLASVIYKCQPTSSSKSSTVVLRWKKKFKVSQINYFSLFITKINNFFRFSAKYSRTHAHSPLKVYQINMAGCWHKIQFFYSILFPSQKSRNHIFLLGPFSNFH